MYIIWHDNDFDFALWVYENSSLRSQEVVLKCIPKTNSFELIKKCFTEETDYNILPLIKLATPDIIIQKIEGNKSEILFASEFMTHTPQHDHVFQRFERIYCISKEKIPVAFILPSNKVKLEKGTREDYREVNYKTNPLAVHTYLKTNIVNNNPTLIFFWPEENGYLKYDSKHQTAPKIEGDILKWFSFLEICIKKEKNENINKNKIILEQIKYMENNYLFDNLSFHNIDHKYFLNNFKKAYDLERARIVTTETAIKEFNINEKYCPKEFNLRKYTFIFEYDSKKFRTDPYCGFVCGYDNLFCRDDYGKKILNFIHRPKGIKFADISNGNNATFINFSEDLSSCPVHSLKNISDYSLDEIINHYKYCIYNKSKQQRIFGTIPDIIIFDDNNFYNNNERI